MRRPPLRAPARLARIVLALGLCLGTAAPAAAQPLATQLAPGIVRHDASADARRLALPSLSFADPSRREAPGDPVERPSIPVEFAQVNGLHVATIAITPGTSLYGTGEVAGPLLRNGRTATCWNTDAFGYGDDAPSLYQSHPWVLAVRPDGSAFGVLADTSWRCTIDLTDHIVFRAHGPAFPVITIDREHPADVVAALASLTGTIEMPPLWALGYHQCRYSYFPEGRVRQIATEFRARDIPCDALWFDIHYMHGYRCFTFDHILFPDPRQLNADLHAFGFRTVWMIDPGIKAEPGYFVFDRGSALDAWVTRADGSVYQGEVWPGACVFPDFTSADVRSWWASLYRDFLATGIAGVWNDMNEPAVFNVPSKTMPEDNRHRADADLGGHGPHAQYHNVYGMLMVRASREGILAARPGQRPFVLSRANFLGGHRFAATWTGDNSADWYHLESSVPMALNLGLSGQPFSGPDIGGFTGTLGDADAPLFARWMGVGTLLPFARAHTDVRSRNKEPWEFGPQVERTCRIAIERRYRLMPYLYTLFREAHRTGLPVVRPLFFADPADPALRSEDDAFLLGSDLLVSPRLTPDRDRLPVHPRPETGPWRPVTLDEHADPDLPDLFLRAGAILPLGPVMEFTGERPLDPLTLVVALDARGRASGSLYEDAGDGWGFRAGEYRLTRFEARMDGPALTVSVASREGDWPAPRRRVVVRWLNGSREVVAEGDEHRGVRVPAPGD